MPCRRLLSADVLFGTPFHLLIVIKLNVAIFIYPECLSVIMFHPTSNLVPVYQLTVNTEAVNHTLLILTFRLVLGNRELATFFQLIRKCFGRGGTVVGAQMEWKSNKLQLCVN